MFDDLTDEELFAEVLRRRATGEAVGGPLGALCERWARPARYVISKIQSSYSRGSPADADELYQDAVGKFLDRGLDQFRGVSEQMPGRSASPKTFFLRIVKHVAIDFYRRQREDLAPAPVDSDDTMEEPPSEVARAMESSRRREERTEAQELYWRAFERLQEEHPKEAGAWDLYHHQDVEDHEECARRLNISVVNSYKRVSRAQAYMRLYLLDLQQEGGHE
ncbi:RNA polymerase sigma factor [Vitiosangium sp. GDMCC 1.1324]|uniref:RNA polymerase sigma factor n=1 Tax=Vitiosangium sp. (strain GDMCC 1.1324) TaxID=2138576 RepID=UPI000D3B6D37|nr:RNA polymerase sigma factor [Vitiosangium sp. GDMCC 1.1324]PTL79408.1 RNA polymerase subunit sigma-70 [Vitiosangium sp. GDMCC 1.1324]